MSGADSDAAVRMLLSGRVQGVGFRYFTWRTALELGLVGWVRNLPAGEVEVRAAGTAAALTELGRRLRQGPPGARVDALEESPLAAAEWSGFEIRY